MTSLSHLFCGLPLFLTDCRGLHWLGNPRRPWLLILPRHMASPAWLCVNEPKIFIHLTNIFARGPNLHYCYVTDKDLSQFYDTDFWKKNNHNRKKSWLHSFLITKKTLHFIFKLWKFFSTSKLLSWKIITVTSIRYMMRKLKNRQLWYHQKFYDICWRITYKLSTLREYGKKRGWVLWKLE